LRIIFLLVSTVYPLATNIQMNYRYTTPDRATRPIEKPILYAVTQATDKGHYKKTETNDI